MDFYCAKVDVDCDINEKINFKVSALRNLNRHSGFLEDSDWLSSRSKNPDIFSRSRATLDLWELGMKTQLRLSQQYWTGIGLMASQRDFSAYDVVQTYPNNPATPPIYKYGKVITYSQTQLSPIWEFGMDHTLKDSLTMQVAYTYSPYVWVSDRDDHLLRSKLSTGDLTGQSYQWHLGLSYPFSKRLSGNINYISHSMTATGRQLQSRYQDTPEGRKGPIAELDEKIRSDYWSVTLGMTYHFTPAPLPLLEPEFMSDWPKASLTPIIALTHRVPLDHWQESTGPTLELHVSRWTIGCGYFSGQNKVDAVSSGRYTSIPIYGLYSTPLLDRLTLELGGGYSFNTNTMDVSASSRLNQLGYLDANEKVSSCPFALIGLHIKAPKRQPGVSYGIRYSYQEPTVTAISQSYRHQDKIAIGQIEALIRVAY
jgi:hypothetical protein